MAVRNFTKIKHQNPRKTLLNEPNVRVIHESHLSDSRSVAQFILHKRSAGSAAD
jgi:hypothetical protein